MSSTRHRRDPTVCTGVRGDGGLHSKVANRQITLYTCTCSLHQYLDMYMMSVYVTPHI